MNNDELKVIEDFLTEEECLSITSYMDSVKDRKFWIENSLRQMIVNSESEIMVSLLSKYIKKIREVLNNENLYITEYMLSRYNPGFKMDLHSDLEDGKDHFSVTAVAYLNNDFSGGDIVFPDLDFRHSPKMGDLTLFNSGSEKTSHGVEVVKTGIRYAMPIWISENPDLELKFLNKKITP